MKTIAAFAILIAATSIASAQQRPQPQQQVQRQTNPPYDLWCREMSVSEGWIQVCSAYTEAQCMASRNPGDASCYLNPKYDPRFRRQ